ncbi:hypothetical protein AAMO2058_000276400 [Amorphochlora amoebiformis]
MARLDSVVRRFEEISAIAERIAGIDVPSPLNVPKIPKVRIATLEELNLFDGAPDAMSALEISEGGDVDTMLLQLKKLSLKCPNKKAVTNEIYKLESEMERVTSSMAELKIKAASFDEQVKGAVAERMEKLNMECESEEKAVHSLEMKLSRMKEKQLLLQGLKLESDQQLLLQKQIDGANLELKRMKKLYKDIQSKEAHSQELKKKKVKTEKIYSETKAASQSIELEVEELSKKANDLKSTMEKYEKNLEKDEKEIVDSLKIKQEAMEREMKDQKEELDKKAQEKKKSTVAVDPFLVHLRARLLNLLDERAEEKNPVALAMKCVVENDGPMLQKDLKKKLRNLLTPSKATTTMYNLIGLRLVKIDRSVPKNACVVSCI